MQTIVYQRQPTRFDISGQTVGTDLKKTEKAIADVPAEALLKWATEALESRGFDGVVNTWGIEIYTLDAEYEDPDERSYCVRWINKENGYIEVIGILIHDGIPNLDHGLAIG
ncbi:hypothetical protein [Endozoicomonas ascidiicola]|uniref:hypothetical protein n=1 Tax=Endozoicomonas ascidiicola TaxID=1698521 RepID=UPI000AC3096E|nr:hypothetical protein [Endozoicomonas ascidiicola]